MTNTAVKMFASVGQEGLLATGKLLVPVRVVDSRYVFGRTDILVEPIGGQGKEWVELSRVKFSD